MLDLHANPPFPPNTTLLANSVVTPAMSQWAVQVLHDASVPLFGTVARTIDGIALVARKEWHPPDFQNHVWHTGVTLYRCNDSTRSDSPPSAPPASVTAAGTASGAVGALGTDSLELVDTAEKAAGLRAAGIDFVLQYLGTATASSVNVVLSAGLAFMPVTRANHWDGPTSVTQLAALGLPQGCTVWLDVEGVQNPDVPTLIANINAWAKAVSGAGYMAGVYVGAGALLTSQELYELTVTRYWKSQSRVQDRYGNLAEPQCGWCMLQTFPSTIVATINVDVDIVQQDYLGRVPVWVVQGASARIA
jgi:hypothetical protein